jgi:hypothetical protein
VTHLLQQFDAIDRNAQELVGRLTEEQGMWRPDPSAWSVAECLDHLAITNRVYLDAMREPSRRARQDNQLQRSPAVPGVIGRWFVRSLEPPVKKYFKAKARKIVQPSPSPQLSDAFEGFKSSQQRIREYIDEFAAIDLANIRFPNPFVPGVRFSLATGLHVLAAHERRHLWQASQVAAAMNASA